MEENTPISNETTDCIPVVDEQTPPMVTGTADVVAIQPKENEADAGALQRENQESRAETESENANEVPAANVQATHGAPITIAFSVYTANNGYDWSNIPDGADREGLDYFYQKAVAFKPDFMVAGDVVKGVFSKDGNVAAFRIQIVKRWDCFGRNADYCAFAFVGAEDAKLIDFDALLEQPEFTEPTHTPPASVCYTGELSKDVNSDDSKLALKRLYNGEELNDFDFAKIGALISSYWDKCDEWLFSKVKSAYENSTLVKTKGWREDPFPPPPSPPPPPEPEPSPIQEVNPPSSAQLIAPIVGEIPQPNTAKELAGIRRLDKPSAGQVVPVQNQVIKTRPLNSGATYRTPTQGQNYRLGDGTYMRPVTQKEMEMAMVNNLVNDSKKSESLDWMHWALIGLCVLLAVLIIVFLLLQQFFSNGKEAGIGDANVEQRSNGELPIRDLGETSDSNPKGGK